MGVSKLIYSSRYLRLTEEFMVGPDIEYLQKRLKQLSFFNTQITGKYDFETASAVKDFQEKFNLNPNGIVGPDTYNAIGLDPYDLISTPVGGYQITIDIGIFNLLLYQYGEFISSYPVAVGTSSTPSPLGSWNIIQKNKNPGGPFGSRWMKLSVSWGGYGIHGNNNPSSIGRAASHGCIRLFNDDVIELYDTISLGTPVQILGSAYTGRLLKISVTPGEDISEVQRILQILAYYRSDIDGYYGPITEKAVKDFQRNNNLIVDGIVGSSTYEALQRQKDITLGDTLP